MDSTMIVGIDVGTTKICTLVGNAVDKDNIRIVGVGNVPSRGIRKGIVTNVKEATAAIAESIHEAEQSSGYPIEHAYVGLAGSHISAQNNRGAIALNNGHRVVQPNHLNQVLESAKGISLAHDREILHIIPRHFAVDGESGIQDPVGMHANQLEVEAHIVTGATTSINNLVQCVQANQVTVNGLVLEPLASGEAVLDRMERDMGVALVDIGGGTTDIGIFIEGSIWHTAVLPVGGELITNDVAIGLRTNFDTAEQIKIKHGHTLPEKISDDETVQFESFGTSGPGKVSRTFLTEIINARTEEILEMVQQEIKRSGYDNLLTAGVVLCGGSANLAGISQLGGKMMNMPARLGAPRHLRGMVANLDEPAYATSVGLLAWGQDTQPKKRRKPQRNSIKVLDWLKVFLPD